jgi:SHS2 domain-containing protein
MPDDAGFEVLEHTADAGIVARGATPAEAFAQAARGMYALMVDIDRVAPREAREIALEAPDLEHLLAHWLVELLYLTETEGLVFSSFDVDVNPELHTLRARVHGDLLNEEHHDAGYDVKAVTYHGLEVC